MSDLRETMIEGGVEVVLVRPELYAGQLLSNEITEYLDQRILFPVPGDEMALADALERLYDTKVDIDKVFEGIAEINNQLEGQAFGDRLEHHKKMLSRGKALFPADDDNEEPHWEIIHPKHREEFEQGLNTVVYQPPDKDKRPTDEDLVDFCLGCARPLLRMADDLKSRIPVGDDLVGKNLPEWVIPDVVYDEVTSKVMTVIRIDMDNPKAKGIVRQIYKYIDLIDTFVDDPEGFILGYAVDHVKGRMPEHVKGLADPIIAGNNQAISERLMPIERRRSEKPKPQGDAAKELAVEPTRTTPAVEFTEEVPETDGLVDVGEANVTLPWINKGEATPIDVKKFGSNGSSVYVLRALGPKMAKIAEAARGKVRPQPGENDTYDITVEQIARRIAEGIMPWQDSNSIKRANAASDNTNKTVYKDTSIWYSFKVGPNTQRIYFTVTPASEVVADGSNIDGYDPDKLCVVVLAETDKANQIKVLQAITGKSRRNLRESGAGSI